jgi:DNA-directed RNA polymerase subunit RPC12/RpoP
MRILGQDRRFSMKWANKNHNALGNYLHAPTMSQIEEGKVPTAVMMAEKATEVANECEQILNSPVFNVNFGHFFEFDCTDCNTHIRRRVGSFTSEKGVVCPKCHATYNVESTEGGDVLFHLRQSKYNCQRCGAENCVGTHHVADGAILECAKCGKKALIQKRFEIVIEEDAHQSSVEKPPGSIQ